MDDWKLVGEIRIYEIEVRRRLRGESELLAILTTEDALEM